MEMCGRVDRERARRDRARVLRFLFSWLFRTVPRPFPVSLFLSFFLSFFFLDWEVSVSFSCLTSFFVCARAQAFLFCSGWLLDFPAPLSLLSICHPLRKIHKHDECWLQGDFFVTCPVWGNESATLTQFCPNTSVRRLQVCFRGVSAAGGKQANSSSIPRCWRDEKLESTLTNENNKKLRFLIADLKSHVKLALPRELTRQNRHVHAGLSRRRTTTRSPTVRLNSKLSMAKATLTSRTEKIRRQNIRLNSCSFTLKARSDSDDMVRQKSSKKQRKSLAGDAAGMLTFAKFAIEECAARGHVRGHATVLHDNNTEG